jgi:hypothetical protein
MFDALEQAAQRRDGVLPPSTRPPAAPLPVQDPAAVDGVNPNQGKKPAGSCPFIGRAA